MRLRSVLVLVVSCLVPFAAGCGSSDAALDMGSPDTGSDLGALDAAPPDLDMGATDGGDGGASNDAAPPDLDMGATDGGDGGSALDAGHDAGEPDAGLPVVQVCQACILDEQCPLDADCLDFGPNRLCFIRVQDEFSACPRTFEAAQLASSPGLFHCLPTEGCCIDEDDDNHGQGVFCVRGWTATTTTSSSTREPTNSATAKTTTVTASRTTWQWTAIPQTSACRERASQSLPADLGVPAVVVPAGSRVARLTRVIPSRPCTARSGVGSQRSLPWRRWRRSVSPRAGRRRVPRHHGSDAGSRRPGASKWCSGSRSDPDARRRGR
jgi:hypothetical protein